MKILGIEFGTWSVKAVEMESRFRRLEILDFFEVRLPLQTLDSTASYKQATQELLRRVSGRAERIVTSLPPSQTALRFLQVPIKQRKKVEQMYRFELEDNVPFKIDDAITEHFVSRFGDGSLVFAAMALKRHVSAHLEWLKAIGVDPDWLTFDGMGVVNLYLSQIDPKLIDPEKGPTMLLDIGHQKTSLSIFERDRVQFFRTITWGGAQITQNIAMSLSVTLEEAEKCKITDLKLDEELEGASNEKREIALAASQSFTSFLADINHSLVAYRTLYGTRVANLLITGGTSKTWGIENFLEKSLDMPVSTFKPFEKFSVKESQKERADEARFGESLGRAFVNARQASLLFNFRKGEMGKETSLTEVSEFLKNPAILTLLKYAGVFALVLFVHVNVAGYIAEREAKASTQDLTKVLNNVFPDVPTKLKQSLSVNPAELKKFVNKKIEEVDKRIKLSSKTRAPMLGIVLQVNNALPPDVKVDVNRLTLDDRSFMLEGVLYEGDIKKVTDNLQKIPAFDKVDLKQDGQRFTYRGELKGR